MEKKRKQFTVIVQSLGLFGFAVAALSSSQKAVESVNGFREGFEMVTGEKLTGSYTEIKRLDIDSVNINQPDFALNE